MATINPTIAAPSFRDTLAAAALRLLKRISENSQMNRAAAVAARLSKCSDAELEKLGIQRDQIYYYAFSRYFYV